MNPLNPVDLINHPFRHSDIDYGFRPSSYWEPPAGVLAAVLRNVKGSERRAMIRDYFKQGRLDELLPELTCDELNQESRERLGRIHPSFMGGEYLPGYRANEVEIVRMEFRSTTADVVSDDGDSVPHRNFMSITSDVYPDLIRHYERLINRWVDAYAISEIGDEEAAE
jgi:hypothetical protein